MLRHGAALCSIGFQEPTPGDGLLPLEPVPDWSLSELALKNVELCPPDRQSKLTLDWYGALVSRYIDFDLGEEFLADFENLEEDKALQQLRALAVEADLAQYRKSPDALFPLNSWAWERSLLNSEQIDRYHIARYLLDTKSDLAKVKRPMRRIRKQTRLRRGRLSIPGWKKLWHQPSRRTFIVSRFQDLRPNLMSPGFIIAIGWTGL